MNRKTGFNWLRSAAVNLVILAAVLVATHMMYETNDDYVIAQRIVDGYPEVTFVNYYLCRLLVPLQRMIPSLNAYILFQIAGSFLSFTCILKLIMDRTDRRIIHIASALIIAVFAFDHYCTLQFTKTAALMTTAGLILMTEAITRKRNAGYIILSLILLYAGVGLRVDGLLGALAFMGVYGLYWLFINRKRLIEERYFTGGRIVLYVFLIAMIGGCYVFNTMSIRANQATPELAAFWDYTMDRSEVIDFPVYDRYDEFADQYEAIGISENDMYLMDHWYLDYDGAATDENFRKIINIYKSGDTKHVTVKDAAESFVRSSIRSVRKLGYTGIHLILLCVIAIWMFVSMHPKHWIYILMTGMMTIVFYVVVYYMERPAYRALYSADIDTAMWLLFALSGAFGEDCDVSSAKRRKPLFVMGVCTALIAAIMVAPVCIRCNKAYNGIQSKVMPTELAEYIQANDSDFFLFATTEKKSNARYLTPWKAPDTAAEKNLIGTGSWGTTSPYTMDKLSAYGITNPMKDIIDSDNIYFIGNKRIKKLTKYYNKWYGGPDKTISMEQTGEVGGYAIWRIVAQ